MLALIVGFFDLIPQVGSAIAAFIVVTITLIAAGAFPAVVLLLVILVYQQVENYLIQPAVMSEAVELSGFATIAVVMLGSALLGVVGAILAVPGRGLGEGHRQRAHRGTARADGGAAARRADRSAASPHPEDARRAPAGDREDPNRGGPDEHGINDAPDDEIGPIDIVVFSYPPGARRTGEAVPLLIDLVDRGIIRVLDALFVTKAEDGSVAGFEAQRADRGGRRRLRGVRGRLVRHARRRGRPHRRRGARSRDVRGDHRLREPLGRRRSRPP